MSYSRAPSLLGHGLGTSPWSVSIQVAEQEESSGEQMKLHLYWQPLLIAHITAWVLPPVRSAAAWGSHRSSDPTVNCAFKGWDCTVFVRILPDHLPLLRGKSVFPETGPSCQKGWGPLSYGKNGLLRLPYRAYNFIVKAEQECRSLEKMDRTLSI